MGNQPSTPSSQAPMPLPPVCDSNCQRQKLLSGLKTNLDLKEETKDQDPEGYEQARIAYYTALNGDSWLINEKNRIAKDEIAPKITSYTDQYNDLKKQKNSNQVFINLMNALQAEEVGDEQDLHYLRKQVQSEKDKISVLNRLTVLGGTPTTDNMPLILDIVLAILGLIVLYLLYKKFDVIKGYFGYSTPVMNMGGKRLPH
jgi:hypothetical protein